MDCGSVGDVGTVANSNLVAVPHHGKKSRRDDLILIQPNSILTQPFSYMFFLSHLIFLSLTFLSLTHLIAGSYPIGGYLDYIIDKPKLE